MIKMVYGNSFSDPDVRYLLKGVSNDSFIIDTGREISVFAENCDMGALQEEAQRSKNKDVKLIPVEKVFEKAAKEPGKERVGVKLASAVVRELDLIGSIIFVSNDFSLAMADYLRKRNMVLNTVERLYPERKHKSRQELNDIYSNIISVKRAFSLIESVLRFSKTEAGCLFYKDEVLTSQRLRHIVELFLFNEEMVSPRRPIISCGIESANPRRLGTGLLLPGEPIVCDIYPVHRGNGFYTDITRTYVKGSARSEVKKAYQDVANVFQELARLVKPGMLAKDIQLACCQYFSSKGREVGDKGFIHSVGHGIGLENHEPPFINAFSEDVIEEGDVICLEPGLYYKEWGGIRLEDMFLVEKEGAVNMSGREKEIFEIV